MVVRGGGGRVRLMFARYVPLASQSPYPIIDFFFWPIIDPILVTFWKMQFSRSQVSHFLFMHLPYQRGFKRRNVMRSMRAYC